MKLMCQSPVFFVLLITIYYDAFFFMSTVCTYCLRLKIQFNFKSMINCTDRMNEFRIYNIWLFSLSGSFVCIFKTISFEYCKRNNNNNTNTFLTEWLTGSETPTIQKCLTMEQYRKFTLRAIFMLSNSWQFQII